LRRYQEAHRRPHLQREELERPGDDRTGARCVRRCPPAGCDGGNPGAREPDPRVLDPVPGVAERGTHHRAARPRLRLHRAALATALSDADHALSRVDVRDGRHGYLPALTQPAAHDEA
jgi:hypothetical protein